LISKSPNRSFLFCGSTLTTQTLPVAYYLKRANSSNFMQILIGFSRREQRLSSDADRSSSLATNNSLRRIFCLRLIGKTQTESALLNQQYPSESE
jgi:hypothetical protein